MNKLQQTAKRCLEVLGTFELDMKYYNSLPEYGQMAETTCGTTFCLAGYLAHIDGYPKQYLDGNEFSFTEYSADRINHDTDSAEWEFMFNDLWPNDLELTRKRMEYVIEHGTVPPVEEWKEFERHE